jgi:RHS repeat-associated protein
MIDTAAPYRASVSGLAAGTHTLSAVAEDNLGKTAQPGDVTIYVRNSVVKGNVDGVSSTGLITGWACSTYLPQSISVDVYVGGPYGTGTAIGRFTANKSSEAAVASACSVGSGSYRYEILLSDAQRIANGGKAIYAYGISPIGASNNLLPGSASFTVPTYVRNAQYVGQTVSSTMLLGHTQSVSVTMRNNGNAAWAAGSSFKLGSQNPVDNSTWGISRANLTSAVAPGQTATFNFTITAPATPGSYNFQWKMLQEGVAWFGDSTPNVSIAVNGPPPVVFASSSIEYDELGRVIKRLDGAGVSVAKYTYDGEGHVTSVTDGLNKVTTMEYDALGRLAKSTNALNGVTQYAYDVADNLIKVTDPRGLVTSYTYDGFGQLWTQTSPDTGTSRQTFDTAGQLVSSTRNDGNTVSYSYDSMGRLTHKTAGQDVQDFAYDSCAAGLGRLCAVSDAMSSESFSYSPEGDVILQKLVGPNSASMTTTYAYDGSGRLATLGYPGGAVVQYSYAAGKISLLKVTQGGVSTDLIKGIAYDPTGQPTYWLYGNNAYRMQSFDLNGRLSSLKTMAGSNALQNYNFVYNAANLLTQRVDIGTPVQSATYAYDALGRLTSEATNESGSRLDYAYDGNGNRTSINWVGIGVTNQTMAANSNQLKQNGADVYTYNANGDRESWTTGSSTAIYTYDAFGRMLATSRNVPYSTWTTTYPAGVTSYAVNPLGQRVYKEGPGGEFWFDYSPEGQLLSDYTAGQGWTNYVYFQGQPVALVRGGAISYLHDDHLGRPESATNAGQAVVWSAINTPFGQNLHQGSLAQMNLGFPGQYYDTETGHWYNVNRDYDQGTGRYLESDPIGLGGGVNTYAYVGNNPLSGIDPYGLWDWPSLPQGFVDASAGFGDALSFGLTGLARNSLGISSVDECSGYYEGGQAAGIVVGLVDGEGEAEIAASIGSKAFRTEAESLQEQLALEEAVANDGERIMQGRINDPAFPEDQFAKMQWNHESLDGSNIVIHYWQEIGSGTKFGFKFK